MFRPGFHSRDNGSREHGAALLRLPWLWLQHELQLLLHNSPGGGGSPHPKVLSH